MGEDLSGVPDKKCEKRKFRWGEFYDIALFLDCMCAEVNLQRSDAVGCSSGGRIVEPEGRAKSGKQLPAMKRFRKIVVRAGVKGGDNILFRLPDRQNDDGIRRPLSKLPQYADTVAVGQAEVEQDGVETIGARQLNTLFSCCRDIDLVPCRFERHAQQPAHLFFVVNDEQ